MGRTVDGFTPVNANIRAPAAFDVDATGTGAGLIPAALNGTVTVVEYGNEAFHKSVFTFTDMPQAVVNGTEYQGTKFYSFPTGRIHVLGVVMSLAQKTTSVLIDTLNASSTGSLALGTVTASNVSLTSTMVNLCPATAFTSSATSGTAGAAVTAPLAAAAVFATAQDCYLNSAYATTGDVDADATQTWTGTVVITWANLTS